MKSIKITGITILLLLLCFLSIGFFIDQLEYEAEIEINRPVPEVFSLFTNSAKLPEWLPEVKEITPLKETRDTVGNQYKLIILNEGEQIEIIETLTAYRNNHLIEMEFNANLMHKINRFEFRQELTTTKIRAHYTVTGSNLIARSIFYLSRSRFRKIDQQTLDRFKKVAEGEY